MSTKSALPTEIRGRLESVGINIVERPDRAVATFRNGGPLVEFSFATGEATWADAALEAFLRMVVAYADDAKTLKQNRSRDTFTLRASVRDRLGIDRLLAAASAAGARVVEKQSLTSKELTFWHPSFGEFARATVFRGQSHVVDLMFASPTEFLAVSCPLEITDSCRKAAALTKPQVAPAASPRPAPGPDDDWEKRRRLKAAIRGLFAENCDPQRDAILASAAIAESVRRDEVHIRGAVGIYGAPDAKTFIEECRALSIARYGGLWIFLRQRFGMSDFLEGEMTSHLRMFVPALKAQLRRYQLFGPPGVEIDDDVEAWIGAIELLGGFWSDGRTTGVPADPLFERLWATMLDRTIGSASA